jgi:hypothetical protein
VSGKKIVIFEYQTNVVHQLYILGKKNEVGFLQLYVLVYFSNAKDDTSKKNPFV